MAKQTKQRKDSLKQLRNYIKSNPYIEILEQPKICASFGLPYVVKVFREVYRKRVYDYLNEHLTTMATVCESTKIPHKYLCEVKAYYEKRQLLKVVYLDKCPTTNSKNVQFVSTNPNVWNDDTVKPKTNQMQLFD